MISKGKLIIRDSFPCYLEQTEHINWQHPKIASMAQELTSPNKSIEDKAASLFYFVRDDIHHSIDIKNTAITCTSSEVLEKGHGICFAKSHLLVALYRAIGIPSGFSYQKLVLNDEGPQLLYYLHGLTAFYLETQGRWFRIDPRGNKPGIDAKFSLESNCLPFSVQEKLGERDYLEVFSEPVSAVLSCFSTVSAWDWDRLDEQLPQDL